MEFVSGGLKSKKVVKLESIIKRYEKKSVTQLKKSADKYFSLWVRNRGSKDGYNNCVTCEKNFPVNSLQAGHFVSRSANSLRFNDKNVWPQCVACNVFASGRMDAYALKMVQKFGPEILTWFQKEKRKIKQFDKKELISLIEKYKPTHPIS